MKSLIKRYKRRIQRTPTNRNKSKEGGQGQGKEKEREEEVAEINRLKLFT